MLREKSQTQRVGFHLYNALEMTKPEKRREVEFRNSGGGREVSVVIKGKEQGS